MSYGPYPPPQNRPPAGMPSFPAPPVQVQQWQNGYGVAGFVLGLIGLLMSFVPIVGVVSWILAPLGLVFCILGLSRVSKGIANNKGLALAGIVLCGLAILVCFIWLAAIGNTASKAPTSSVSSAGVRTYPTITPATPAAQAPSETPPPNTFTDGIYEVGVDIPAGKYQTPGDVDSIVGCMTSITKDGSSRTLLDYDSGNGQRKITLKSGTYVEFNGGCPWTKVG